MTQSEASQAPRRTSERPRRTQQQRRDATRALLMQATVASLVEQGYRGTTTLEIERRAEVSRGARIHHFPTKAALLAAAVDHLYNRLSDHYDEAFGQAPPGTQDARRLRSGLRLLWSLYCSPGYAAVLELNMAARTDDELRAQLQEVGARHRELALAAARVHFALVPETALHLVEAIHATMLGLLMQRNVEPCEARESATLELLEVMVVEHLPGGRSDGGGR
ncbi:MAG: TetR/AcrR family transcriptional regulator [Myxococcales bacterium]|nr:TetR/AcrR family transcriptional regulator [Myxococcales bacterium]